MYTILSYHIYIIKIYIHSYMYHKYVYMMVFIMASLQYIILNKNPNSEHYKNPGPIFQEVIHLEEIGLPLDVSPWEKHQQRAASSLMTQVLNSCSLGSSAAQSFCGSFLLAGFRGVGPCLRHTRSVGATKMPLTVPHLLPRSSLGFSPHFPLILSNPPGVAGGAGCN